MADLLIRAGYQDAALLPRLLETPGDGLPKLRVVVDGHVAARQPSISAAAKQGGAPLLVDPQTYFLQDVQPSDDPWCRLPFGVPAASGPDELKSAALDALIESVALHQLQQGATAIIAPYFFLGRREIGWTVVQARVWRRTRHVLESMGIGLPVIAVTALDWTRLQGVSEFTGGGELDRALRALEPSEIALSGSKSHLGSKPHERVLDLCASVVRLSRIALVIAWHQGLLGEACVVAGALGYETGIGHREAVDMPSLLSSRRSASPSGPRSARPVFVRALMRSIPKTSIVGLSEMPRMWPSMFCVDVNCCAPGGQTMLRDARVHAVRARRQSLADLTSVGHAPWRWGALADKSEVGLRLAQRINRTASPAAGIFHVDVAALRGMNVVATGHRRGSGAIQVA